MNNLTFLTDNKTDLASFAPVSGTYDANRTSLEMETINATDIEDAISAALAKEHGFPVKVELFQPNGHALIGETPSAGSFLATRSRITHHAPRSPK